MTDASRDKPSMPAEASPSDARFVPLPRLDAWMEDHPAHPRFAPFLVYLVFLAIISAVRPLAPVTYPFLYVIQCAVVGWLLWRYRKLLPELTLKFHYLGAVVGVWVAAAWIGLGHGMASLNNGWFGDEGTDMIDQMGPVIGWLSMSVRLLGMAILVPIFEELFIRSLCLRSFHRFKPSITRLFQFIMEIPVLDDLFARFEWARRIADREVRFANELKRTPLGVLSVWGVFASTLIFMLSHAPRDWPGIWVCGISYCLLLQHTREKGLGPVIWAHGVTNALLWGYTLARWDWRFL